jgi:hypothetical protein
MALIQKMKTTGKTFGELSDSVHFYRQFFILVKDSKRIDLVFDVCCNQSIKMAERIRRVLYSRISSPHNELNSGISFFPPQRIRENFSSLLSTTRKRKEMLITISIFTLATIKVAFASVNMEIMMYQN